MPSDLNKKSNKRVLVIYNCDYDEELMSMNNVDISAVKLAAVAVGDAIVAYGFACEVVAVHGLDLPNVITVIREHKPDLVFNLCESLNGDVRNEMIMPAVLDMLSIPYTGAGALSISMCLYKQRAKEIMIANRVSTPQYRVLSKVTDLDCFDLQYPVFLKLVHEDASIGIEASNLVHDQDGLRRRTTAMLEQYRQPILVERYIEGREVNVAVLGNGSKAQILPLYEIDFRTMPLGRPRIVSYAAKWDESHIDYQATQPVPMKSTSPDLVTKIEQTALTAYRALGLRDFGRVDVRIDAAETVWVIDVNPNCDLSADAGYARSANAAGMEYPDLIGRVCEIAWSRYENTNSQID